MHFVIFTVDNYHSGSGHYSRMKPVAKYLESIGYSTSFFFIDVEEGYMQMAADVFIIDVDTVDYENKAISICSKYKVPIVVVNPKSKEVSKKGVKLVPISIPIPNCLVDHRYFNVECAPASNIVFLNQGASDPWGLTTRLLTALAYLEKSDFGDTMYVNCVVGNRVSNLLNFHLYYLTSHLCRTTVHYDAKVPDILYMMKESYCAVTAPGQMYCELSVVGIPSIIIGHHQLHYSLGNRLHRKGVAAHLGCGRDIKDEDLVNGLKYWLFKREQLITIGRKAQREALKFGPQQFVEMMLDNLF